MWDRKLFSVNRPCVDDNKRVVDPAPKDAPRIASCNKAGDPLIIRAIGAAIARPAMLTSIGSLRAEQKSMKATGVFRKA